MSITRSVAALAKTVARHALRPVRPFLDDFLGKVPGVIHVGASSGQERDAYARLGLRVIWVEAIPDVFAELERNIAALPGQRAINAVLSKRTGETVTFNVASNNGESSSLLPFKNHSADRPDIRYVQQIELTTSTLAAMVEDHGIDLASYPALVLDVQGAEMMVLEGAGDLLKHFRYIKAEASEGEPYEGCCSPEQLESFMRASGFRVQRRVVIATNSTGHRIYDIVFRRI